MLMNNLERMCARCIIHSNTAGYNRSNIILHYICIQIVAEYFVFRSLFIIRLFVCCSFIFVVPIFTNSIEYNSSTVWMICVKIEVGWKCIGHVLNFQIKILFKIKLVYDMQTRVCYFRMWFIRGVPQITAMAILLSKLTKNRNEQNQLLIKLSVVILVGRPMRRKTVRE